MPDVNALMLVGGLLLLLGIASSKFSARLGLPVLVLFLGLGMLAGSEGVGGIAFEDYRLASGLGSIALALILFDGGLRTSLGAVRTAWRPALSLATFPLMAGVENASLLFDVVFFVVLVSAVTQGWSLPVVARWLGLARPSDPEPPLSVEINALRHVDGEIVEYTVAPSARVAGQAIRDLALPDGIVMTLVVRDDAVIMPRGATRLRPGDHVFVAMRAGLVPVMDRLFDPGAETPDLAPGLTLAFPAQSTVGQLHRFFGIPGPTWSEEPVGALLDAAADGAPQRLGPFVVTPGEEAGFVTLTYAQPEAVVQEGAD